MSTGTSGCLPKGAKRPQTMDELLAADRKLNDTAKGKSTGFVAAPEKGQLATLHQILMGWPRRTLSARGNDIADGHATRR